jgi:hypothetical protein
MLCPTRALLVLLGFGLTTVLTFFTAIPGWENFGAYEMWYFVLSGGLLAAGFYLAYSHQALPNQNCETSEGDTKSVCSTATRWNRKILWLSLSVLLRSESVVASVLAAEALGVANF